MSRMEYRMAIKHVSAIPDKDSPLGRRWVTNKEWMQDVAELAAEGWTIHSVDYKSDRCIMEREIDD